MVSRKKDCVYTPVVAAKLPAQVEILVRSKTERESKEQYQVERGLLRSVILEGLIFVPVSATLMWLFSPLIKAGLDAWLPKFPQQALSSFYVGLGLLSYGFPFASAQRFVVHRSLKLLKNYAELTPEELQRHRIESNEQPCQKN